MSEVNISCVVETETPTNCKNTEIMLSQYQNSQFMRINPEPYDQDFLGKIVFCWFFLDIYDKPFLTFALKRWGRNSAIKDSLIFLIPSRSAAS